MGHPIEIAREILFDETTNLALFIYLIITTFLIGGWRLFLYYREDRYFPKIEFFCDVFFKTHREAVWIAEIVCVVKNKGIAGHRVKDLKFTVHGLTADDKLQDGDISINGQTLFPHIVRQGKWKLRPDMNVRVEPNTAQYYRHVGTIPDHFEAIVLHGSMTYKQKRFGLFGKRVIHTANRLIRVPKTLDEAKMLREDDWGLNYKAETMPRIR